MFGPLATKNLLGLQKRVISNPSNVRFLSRFFENNEQDAVKEIRRVNSTALFVIVPQGERWLVERLGKFRTILEPGFHFLIPVFETIAYRHSTKEIPVEISKQTAITKDNVQITIDGVLYFKVKDPYRTSYEIEYPVKAITNLAQTTMRAEIGKITLDKTFSERQLLNHNIVESIQHACSNWGIEVSRYEIKDIHVPDQIRIAMDLEAEAERKKRKQILDSEAERLSAENIAAGRKRATELSSEADMIQLMNNARGEAFAIENRAKATATALQVISESISKYGEQAVTFKIAEEYIKSFAQIARTTNTVIIPSNVSDTSSQIASALTIFNQFQQKKTAITKDEAAQKLVSELSNQTEAAPEFRKWLQQQQTEKIV